MRCRNKPSNIHSFFLFYHSADKELCSLFFFSFPPQLSPTSPSANGYLQNQFHCVASGSDSRTQHVHLFIMSLVCLQSPSLSESDEITHITNTRTPPSHI